MNAPSGTSQAGSYSKAQLGVASAYSSVLSLDGSPEEVLASLGDKNFFRVGRRQPLRCPRVDACSKERRCAANPDPRRARASDREQPRRIYGIERRAELVTRRGDFLALAILRARAKKSPLNIMFS